MMAPVSGFTFDSFEQMECVTKVARDHKIKFELGTALAIDIAVKDEGLLGAACAGKTDLDGNQDMLRDAWDDIEDKCLKGVSGDEAAELKEFFDLQSPHKKPTWWDKLVDGTWIGTGFAVAALAVNGLVKAITGKSILQRFLNGKGPKGPKGGGGAGGDGGSRIIVPPSYNAPREVVKFSEPAKFSLPEIPEFKPQPISIPAPTPEQAAAVYTVGFGGALILILNRVMSLNPALFLMSLMPREVFENPNPYGGGFDPGGVA